MQSITTVLGSARQATFGAIVKTVTGGVNYAACLDAMFMDQRVRES